MCLVVCLFVCLSCRLTGSSKTIVPLSSSFLLPFLFSFTSLSLDLFLHMDALVDHRDPFIVHAFL